MNWNTPREVIDSIEQMLLAGPLPQTQIIDAARAGGRTASYTAAVIEELIKADRLYSFSEEVRNGFAGRPIERRLIRLSHWNLAEIIEQQDKDARDREGDL